MMIEATFRGVGAAARSDPKAKGVKGRSVFFVGVCRTMILCIMFLAASLDYLVKARGTSVARRAIWLHRWSQRCGRLLGMSFDRIGTPPQTGLVVANHLSYLDIIALSAMAPSLFVAKSDVARWPVFGLFARMAGTIFIDRTRRSTIARTAAELKTTLNTGLPVVVFPEGTSSDGRNVLPFKSSLLQPACEGAIPITPVAIDYVLAEGAVGDLVCYWGEMTLLPHLLKLLTLRQIGVHLTFGFPSCSNFHRKTLAVQLRQEVVAMRNFRAKQSTVENGASRDER